MVLLLGTAGVWLVSRGLAEETHEVEVKDKEVIKNFDIDKNDEEPVAPESVETVGETITIVSRTFTPPGTMTFKEFPGTATRVDIETDPGSLSPVREKDTASEVKVSVAEVPETAGDWPLKGEGNLQPTGPGGGGGTLPHWSAKMAKPILEVFIGQSDQVNDEANFEAMLTDYPAEGGRPRNPKYLFGKEAPIFIQVRNIEPGQGILLDRVRASSESDPVYVEITLKETAPQSGIYRNVVGEWSELLYLGEESGGAPMRLEVIDEEVITFRLMSSTGYYADVQAEYQVMADRAECGSGYYNYVDVPDWGQLSSTTDIHNDFIEMLTDTKGGYDKPDQAPVLWSTYEGAGDAVCRKSHYASPTDSDKADAADIVIWSGHGTDTGTPNNYYCAFLDVSKNIQKLHHGDVQLGNTDAEWAIFQTCRFLNTSKEESNGPGHGTATDEDIKTELKQMFAGCHLVMGYKTKMRMYAHFSEKLINCTDCEQGTDHGLDLGHTTLMAFSRATRHCPMQDQDMYPRYFGAVDCLGDTLYPEGGKRLAPVPLSRDPLATDQYDFYEWKVPQE